MRRPSKSVLRLGALALVVYLIALVADFPAAVAFHLFGPSSPDFRVQGVSGTLWNGRAGPARIGAIAIQHLDWSVNPWPLLVGTLEVQFKMTTPGAGSEQGTLWFTSLNHFRLEHVVASFDPAAGVTSFPELSGRIRLRIHTLEIRHGSLFRLAGQLGARRITLQSPIRLQVGPLSIQAHPAAREVSVIHLTAGSAGDFAGTATITLTLKQGYRLVALIKPEPNAPAFLERLLAGTGQPDPQGFYHLQMKGVLPPLSSLLTTRSSAPGIPP